jgi:hypothetical protein
LCFFTYPFFENFELFWKKFQLSKF